MTDEKTFIREIVGAAIAGDKEKSTLLMAKRTSEHINRIHVEKISCLDAPCLVAAIMKLNELYQSGFDADTIKAAKIIADGIDIAGVRFETSEKVGDSNGL